MVCTIFLRVFASVRLKLSKFHHDQTFFLPDLHPVHRCLQHQTGSNKDGSFSHSNWQILLKLITDSKKCKLSLCERKLRKGAGEA